MAFLRITLTLLALLLLSPLLQAETPNISGDTSTLSHNATHDAVERSQASSVHLVSSVDFDDDIPTDAHLASSVDFDDDIPTDGNRDDITSKNPDLNHHTQSLTVASDNDVEFMVYLLILACAVIALKPVKPSI